MVKLDIVSRAFRLLRSIAALLLALGVPVLTLAATGSGTNFTVSPNMNLLSPVPGVTGALGVEPMGTSWMELQNASFALIDQHDHSPGHGVPVPSIALNINGDVQWNGNNLTLLRSARFTPQLLGSLTALDVGAVFVSGADLYYVDTSANVVRITAAGAIAGTPGSISGLVSPAAATYTPASALFTWTSASGYPAYVKQGPTSVCDRTVSGGSCATIQVPAGMVSNYAFTLPATMPASALPLTISSGGNVVPAQITGSQLSPSAGIIGAQLSGSAGITAAQTTAVSAPTANQLVVRDGNGRAQFADPAASQDAVTYNFLLNGYSPTPSMTSGSATAINSWTINYAYVEVIGYHLIVVNMSVSVPSGSLSGSVANILPCPGTGLGVVTWWDTGTRTPIYGTLTTDGVNGIPTITSFTTGHTYVTTFVYFR